jgi:hypothetical protein
VQICWLLKSSYCSEIFLLMSQHACVDDCMHGWDRTRGGRPELLLILRLVLGSGRHRGGL